NRCMSNSQRRNRQQIIGMSNKGRESRALETAGSCCLQHYIGVANTGSAVGGGSFFVKNFKRRKYPQYLEERIQGLKQTTRTLSSESGDAGTCRKMTGPTH